MFHPYTNQRQKGDNMNYSKDFQKQIKEALDIANDLCYDEKCKEDLRQAQNEIQITNILIAARRRKR